MSVKKLLMDFIATLPDDDSLPVEPPAKEQGDGVRDVPADTGDDKPLDQTPPTEKKIDVATEENVTVDAPPEEKDVTVVNSADMVNSAVEMRLASFYTKQQELEDTVKILLAEVNTLKESFGTIEKAIDVASDTSATVATIDTLVNML